MADDKLHIRLHVYDTELSVNIPREDEEYYRAASKLITDTVNTYSTYFKGKKSDKDILYMACLLYTSPSPRDPKTSRMPSSA